jgi:flagellar M-ring protein FliF
MEKGKPAIAGQPQLADRLAGLWTLGRVRWARMQTAQRGWALASAVLLMALFGGLFWYLLRTDWRTLYADLDPEDARQTCQILTQAQIPFEPTPDGTGIRVATAA